MSGLYYLASVRRFSWIGEASASWLRTLQFYSVNFDFLTMKLKGGLFSIRNGIYHLSDFQKCKDVVLN